MPLYEYNCRRCGKSIEVRQHFDDKPLTVHEGCGGELKRVIFPSALQFKGTGWYVTDYGKNGSSSSYSNGKHSKNDSKAETKSETKSESKPAPKAETTAAK